MSDCKPGANPLQAASALDQAREQGLAGGRLRLLCLCAAPLHAERLKADLEVKQIDGRLLYSEHRSRWELIPEWAVTLEDLSKVLLRYQPAVIHFTGHGTPEGKLVFLDGQGCARPAPRSALSALFSLFRNRGLRCVVLSACYAEEQARAIAEHIEFVVGISGAIHDNSARSFAAGFYSGLAAGMTVAESFDLGRIQIALLGQADADTLRLISRGGADPTKTRLC